MTMTRCEGLKGREHGRRKKKNLNASNFYVFFRGIVCPVCGCLSFIEVVKILNEIR